LVTNKSDINRYRVLKGPFKICASVGRMGGGGDVGYLRETIQDSIKGGNATMCDQTHTTQYPV
jgi:hypothetical protein